jgi:PKD repeat protein
VTGSASTAHTFATAGSYTVTLTVTDDRGATGTAMMTVAVTPFVRVPLVADASDEVAAAACSLASRGASLHVAWYSARHPTVWYATWTNGALNREVVDTFGFNTGGNIKDVLQLVLDSAGNPHVVYGRDDQVWYATKSGGTWLRERVDSSTNAAHSLDRYPPSLALNAADQPTVVYVGYVSNRVVVIATRTGPNAWTQTVPTFPLGTNYGSNLTGHVTFGAGNTLFMPIQLYTSTTGGGYLSHLAIWNGSASEVVSMAGALPGFSAATSLAWAGTGRLLALGGTGLFDIAVGSPLATSTARMSYVEVSATSQHAVATTSTGEPRLVINHGSTLESVWPDGIPGFWRRFDLGPTDSGRIDAAVDSNNDTRACFFRAGKLVLY